jgi:hypothetical protein
VAGSVLGLQNAEITEVQMLEIDAYMQYPDLWKEMTKTEVRDLLMKS